MGYRSDGVIGMTKQLYNLTSLLQKNLPPLFADMDKDDTDEYTIYFSFYNWKMYGSYTDVARFYAWMEEMDDIINEADCNQDKHDLSYGYIEVGEDDGDISTYGSPHDFKIYAHTHIDSPIS